MNWLRAISLAIQAARAQHLLICGYPQTRRGPMSRRTTQLMETRRTVFFAQPAERGWPGPACAGSGQAWQLPDHEPLFAHFMALGSTLIARARATGREIQERVRQVLEKWGERAPVDQSF